MFGVTRPSPSHQPYPSSSPQSDPRLPRGECRFILLHPEVNEQRCSCQGFWLNKSVPMGSACECGHQACYHEPSSVYEDTRDAPSVSRAEYDLVLRRLTALEEQLDRERSDGEGYLHRKVRDLEEALESERSRREEDLRDVYRSIQGVYYNMGIAQDGVFKKLVGMEDRIEGVVDQVCGLGSEVEGLGGRVVGLEEEVALNDEQRPEEGIARDERDEMDRELDATPVRKELRRSLSRAREDPPISSQSRRREETPETTMTSPVAIPTDPNPVLTNGFTSDPPSWNVLVCFTTPASSQGHSHDESYWRPPVRQKLLTIYGSSHQAADVAITTFFSDLIPSGKLWMPLLRPTHSSRHGMSIPRPLAEHQTYNREGWDISFLRSDCSIVALSKGFKKAQDTLFITFCEIPSESPIVRPTELDSAPDGLIAPTLLETTTHPNEVKEETETKEHMEQSRRCGSKRPLSLTSTTDLTSGSATNTNSTNPSTPATSTSNLGPIAIHTTNPNMSPAKRFKLRSSLPDAVQEGVVGVPRVEMGGLVSREVA